MNAVFNMKFRLFIMRHAKSDWSGQGVSDFDRPINKRGQKNARRIGLWMDENNLIPDQIVCSPALRARQTIELVMEQIKKIDAATIYFDESLYLADLETLIEIIQIYKSKHNSLMIVAHNPGLEELVNYLIVQSKINLNYESLTTANLVIFKYKDSQFDPVTDQGKLLEFIRPKELD